MPIKQYNPTSPGRRFLTTLTFEEITRLAGVFVGHGVRKLRLTGGEPLLRKNLEVLIRMLAELRTPDGQPLDITLTTNGSLLERKAQALKDTGLQRVTVSLDALDDGIFRRMNDVDFPVADVLRFESDLLEHLRRNTPILKTIAETQKWDDDTAQAVVAEIKKVKEQFKSGGGGVHAGVDHSKPLADEDIDNEQIRIRKG